MDRRVDDHRLNALVQRVDALEKMVAENTELTKGVREDTASMVEAWKSIAGGMKVLGWLASAGRWVAAFIAAIAAVYAAIRTGVKPEV